MKPATMSSKCFSGARGLSHAGIGRGAASAHKRQRARIAPPAPLGRSPRLSISGHHLGYVEAPPPAHAQDTGGRPGLRRVLHVDADRAGAQDMARLLSPEAQVIHAASVGEARRLLASQLFSLVVIDPALPDGDARTLLPLLSGTPVLVYSTIQVELGDARPAFLAKPWTSTRQLWVAIAGLLGLPASLAAGD